MNSGVYTIVNVITGKVYVGSAVDFDARWSLHKAELRAGRHHSVKFQRSWDKHGPDAFSFARLVVCAPEHLLMYEQIAIDAMNAVRHGYNVAPIAGSTLGLKWGPESRARFAMHERSESHRASIAAAHRGMRLSEEAKAKISAALTGRRHSEETRRKMSASRTGRPCSAETRLKLSVANKGQVVSEEQRLLLSALNTGKRHSEATKAKLRQRRHSPETRAKMAAAHRARNAAKTPRGGCP